MTERNSTAPNLFLVGAARAGTTALSEVLAAHPEIEVSTPKEPHYLAFGKRPSFSGPGDERAVNRVTSPDLGSYLALWTGTGRWRCDASASTLYFPDAIDRLTEVSPDPTVIIVLRHPARRALSAYLYLRSRGYETVENFEDGLRLETDRIAKNWHHMWHYAAMSDYAPQIERVLSAVDRERVHIIVHERLEADPQGELDRLSTALGLGDARLEPTGRVNQSGQIRHGALTKPFEFARHAMNSPTVGRRIPRRHRQRLKRLFVKPTAGEPVELSDESCRRFETQVATTTALIGVVPEWT